MNESTNYTTVFGINIFVLFLIIIICLFIIISILTCIIDRSRNEIQHQNLEEPLPMYQLHDTLELHEKPPDYVV